MPKRRTKSLQLARPTRQAMTADSLQNVITGLGTSRSKLSYNRFQPDMLNGYGELESAYVSNWLAKAIVDIPADDMTREWRSIKCADADEIRAEEDRLMVPHKVNDALTWSRLYGGAAILMLTNQDFEKPLDVNRVRKGDLHRLVVLDRYMMIPGELNTFDIMSENFMQPEYWSVYTGTQRIHHSHFVFFRGTKLPIRLRMQTQGWGDSELRKCMSELKDTISAKGGIAELMQEANLDVITANGLADAITTGQENKITDRYTQYGLMKSIFKLSLLDGDEKLDRMTLNLSGVAPVLEELKAWVVGCSGIPATRLFGEQAKGLGNEGAGDLNNYYDNIRAKQNTYLDPVMHTLDQVLVRSAVGAMPADYNYDWERLYQPNRLELAQARKVEAETHVLNLEAGVIKQSQVMRAYEADEVYHYPEGAIEEMEEAEQAAGWQLEDLTQEAREFESATANELARQTADAWNEADHPRDDEGKFTSGGAGGGASSASTSNQSKKETQKGTMQEAEARGFDTSEVFSHFTNNANLESISSSGNFPGLFSLPESDGGAQTYGKHEYKFVVKGGVAENSDLKEKISEDWSAAEEFVRENTRAEDDETVEAVLDVISGDSLEATDELMDVFGAIDEADFYKEAQAIRMKYAAHVGYGAVRMDDEFGESTVALLPGDKVMMLKPQ